MLGIIERDACSGLERNMSRHQIVGILNNGRLYHIYKAEKPSVRPHFLTSNDFLANRCTHRTDFGATRSAYHLASRSLL